MNLKKNLSLILSIILLIVCFSGCDEKEKPDLTPVPTPVPSATPIAEIEDDVFYTAMTNSNTRCMAVMIDNDKKARPQSGLENAFAVYEMVVEGASTRLMAIFKDCTATKVGPVRSSRHYFLDYALEHDPIYLHCGYSPKAQQDLKNLYIHNLNELVSNNGKNFYRDTQRKAPHNLYASLPGAIESVEGIYNTTTEYATAFPYYSKDTDLASDAVAQKITVPYFNSYSVSYEYDTDKKLYNRFINGEPHMSATDDAQLTAKNILIYKVKNYNLDNAGRQELNTVGTGEGWYITDGKVISMMWNKPSRGARTEYYTSFGKPITFNPGNIYVQIIPVSSQPVIK